MMMMMSNIIRALHNVLLFVATTLPSSSSWSTLPSSSASVRRRATFSSDHDKKTLESSSHKRQQQQQQETMVIVDVENVRGATSFKLSHAALLSRICLWREDRLSTATSTMNYNDDDHASSYYSSPSLQCNSIEPMIWVCDHGIRPSIHHFSSSSSSSYGDYHSSIVYNDDDVAEMKDERTMPCNFGVTFAGPQRTADDVIVDIVKLRCQSTNVDQKEEENEVEKENGILDDDGNGNDDHDNDDDDRSIPPTNIATRNTTVVITADAKLISRCQQSQRAGRSISDVIFVEPASLLMQLERYRINSHEEETFLGSSSRGDDERQQRPSTYSSSGMRKKSEIGIGNVDGKTSTMTSFKDSTIAMEQHAKFQARFQSTLGLDELPQKQNKHDGEDDTVVNGNNYDDIIETQFTTGDSSDDTSAAALLAAQLKTEQIRRHLLLSDAYYLARPSKSVRGRGKAVVHVKYKDRNISKTQQRKLYTRRLGNQRREDMALGATRRKENAARLQQILDNYNGGVDGVTDQNGPLISSSTTPLLHMLLRQFECEKVSQLPNTSSFDPTTVLGLDGTTNGAISKVKQLDPLNSIMKVPLRNNHAMSDTDLPPLRIVVISDTHGFEGALSKFIDSSSTDNNDDVGSPKWVRLGFSDDFILPPADVLIHCGDFAASGSRKTQRIAARRLDDFLARQTHIPEKIVIKGNHDPESPAKVLFPTSKALYVRSSSTMMIHGVSFALEPYSRRAISLQSSIGRRTYSSMPTLPECDILVSHEPPKGILDMTYHGFSAGSLYLRELVEHAEHKPRLWLCGHIHESRGVKHFYPANRRNGGSDNIIDASTTMVINASNANSGKANRLVSGAVVVEIERRLSNTWREETAETTLRSSRRVDYEEGVFDPIDDSSDGLARLGDDLELYTTRPGVRRRKGVAQSVRQQKVIRSTLLTS